MSKEYLEAKAEDISELLYEVYDVPSGICEQIKNMVQRLEEIDNANPSEAMVCLEYLNCIPIGYTNNDRKKDYTIIKQSLLKTQSLKNENSEYKKVLEIIKNKCIGNHNLEMVKELANYTEYLRLRTFLGSEDDVLTQEEFNLLKERC